MKNPLHWLFPEKHEVVSEEYRALRAQELAAEEAMLRQRLGEVQARIRIESEILKRRRRAR